MHHSFAQRLRRLAVVVGALLAPFASAAAQQMTLRVGHFPNVTHAQALVAAQLSRQGKGWFESRLGEGVRLQWFVYNAGPSAMEAVAANSIDLTYVGPNPALNLYVKSQGDEVPIIAGSAEGGAALVVQPMAGSPSPRISAASPSPRPSSEIPRMWPAGPGSRSRVTVSRNSAAM